VRNKHYRGLAQFRVVQSLVTSGLQVGGGTVHQGALGLMGGYLAGFTVVAAYWAIRSARQIRQLLTRASPASFVRVAYEYRRFPIYSTWEAVANNASIHLPVILIASVASTAEAGQLMLAMYVVQAPMALVGSAVAQVFLSEAPEAHRRQELDRYLLEVFGRLLRLGVGPLLALAVSAPLVFEIVFGADWNRAGWLVVWMTPWVVLQFLASPLSMALHIVRMQRLALALQLFGLVVRVSAVLAAPHFTDNHVAEAYAVSGALVYGMQLLAVFFAASAKGSEILRLVARSSLWMLTWPVAAALLAGSASVLWGRG
jgi:O-antigen/teichoic acid export membrane protein